ncbi:MAG: hypothetical protein ACOYL8_01610 [Patescibacteria group bacterium]
MAYSNFYARFYSLFDKIKRSFSAVFQFKSSFIYLAIIIFWQLISWLQAWFIKRSLSGDVLVLHYNVDFGIDLVGDPNRIYSYPLLGLGIFLLNLSILAYFHESKNFKIYIHYLMGSAAVFASVLSVALLSIYLINFR